MGRERRAGGEHAALAQDWPFAANDPHPRMVSHELGEDGLGASAIGTVVVEELDHRDVAGRVAQHGRVGEQRLPLRGDGGAGGLLARLQDAHGLHDDLGILEDRLEGEALDLLLRRLVGEGGGAGQRGDQEERGGRANEMGMMRPRADVWAGPGASGLRDWRPVFETGRRTLLCGKVKRRVRGAGLIPPGRPPMRGGTAPRGRTPRASAATSGAGAARCPVRRLN